jgi:HAD superfamily hydrolase (TIGR01549 family)
MRHFIVRAGKATNEATCQSLHRECAQVLCDAARNDGFDVALAPEEQDAVLQEGIVFEPFGETREVLAELHAREIPMGVLSNWDCKLPQVLERLQLSQFFEFVISSAHVGFEKPSPEIFQRGIEEVRARYPEIETSQIYYIGDHYEKDVLAPRELGLTPLWLVRDVRDVASGNTHVADEPVTQLSTLSDILRVPGLGLRVPVAACDVSTHIAQPL